MTEPTVELLQVICHFCDRPIRVIERTSPDQRDPILDQCDDCNALPSNPEPPAEHLQYVVNQRIRDCYMCFLSPDECECLYCSDCGRCMNEVRAQRSCVCGCTRRISLATAYLELRACDECGLYPPGRACECDSEPGEIEADLDLDAPQQDRDEVLPDLF